MRGCVRFVVASEAGDRGVAGAREIVPRREMRRSAIIAPRTNTRHSPELGYVEPTPRSGVMITFWLFDEAIQVGR